MKSVCFPKAFFGACSGTAIFERLKEHSWLRIVWHTVVLAAVASLIVTLCEIHRFSPVRERYEHAFRAAFGDRIAFSEDQVMPVDAPQKNRLLPLPQESLLIYVGTAESGVDLPEKELLLVQNLIVWGASEFASARQTAPGEWVYGKCILHDGKTTSGGMEQIHTKELIGKLRDFRKGQWFSALAEKEEPRSIIAVQTLGKIVLGLTAATLFLLHLVEFLFTQWFFTAVYAGVFAIFNARRLRHLTMRQYWKVGVYAGFPALAVGACWPALDLPFLDFRLVYMIGLVFYWMAVVGRLEHETDTPDNKQGGRPDEP